MSAAPPTIPTETAATEPVSAFERPNRSSARLAAIHAPVIAAQRVPPSAWRTSQSSHSVRSPSASKSQTARSARPTFSRRGGEHRVLGGHPPASLPVEPARYSLLDGRRAQDQRLPLPEEHGAVRLLEEVGRDLE